MTQPRAATSGTGAAQPAGRVASSAFHLLATIRIARTGERIDGSPALVIDAHADGLLLTPATGAGMLHEIEDRRTCRMPRNETGSIG